jgi:nucleoside-diphosphate-sugar epimerase
MQVFVTGGSGFIGQHLLRTLAGAGHQVRALARSEAAAETVLKNGATPARGDLRDVETLRAHMGGCELAIHAAAHTSAWGPAELFEAVNVAGAQAVVAAAATAGVARLVLVSTEAVLADGRPLVNADETRPRPAQPVGEYARTKGLAEDLVLAADSAELATVAVRPRLVWGPGDTTILPEIVKAAKMGRFAWIGGGRYLTSTCHVANACAGILLAAERGRGGQAYFLTDGEPVEFRAFITGLAGAAGVQLTGRSVPRWLLSLVATGAEGAWRALRLRGEPPVTRTFLALSGQEMTVDDSLARRELGYRPVVTREEGLAELARQSA